MCFIAGPCRTLSVSFFSYRTFCFPLTPEYYYLFVMFSMYVSLIQPQRMPVSFLGTTLLNMRKPVAQGWVMYLRTEHLPLSGRGLCNRQLKVFIHVGVCSVTQLCSTLLWPHGLYSLRGFSVHGISQSRILVWVAIPFSRGSSQPRDWIRISCISCLGRWIRWSSFCI